MSGQRFNLLPIKKKLSSLIWQDTIVPENLSLEELNAFLLPVKFVSFEQVTSYVDEFVEFFVPLQVDKLFSLSGLITKLKAFEDYEEELTKKYNEADAVTEKIRQKVQEIDELSSHIRSEEKDDFDLKINPAKQKLNNAIEYLLETNGHSFPDVHGDKEKLMEQSECRSPRARDLLSFLQDSDDVTQPAETSCITTQVLEESNVPNIERIPDDQLTQLHIEPHHTICQESLEKLNQDLLELHALMAAFYDAVHQQGMSVDTVADNVSNADNNLSLGNVKLRSAASVSAIPLAGAVVGGLIGGPIGLLAGMKIGSIVGGVAVAGVTGSVVGYQGVKMVNKKQQDKGKEEELNSNDPSR